MLRRDEAGRRRLDARGWLMVLLRALAAWGMCVLLAVAFQHPPEGAPRRTAAPAASLEDLRGRLNKSLREHWGRLGLSPALPADDAAFLRRVWLDLAGTVPPLEQTLAFLDDRRPDKRPRPAASRSNVR